ncbi:MAG: hypothetical protein N2112_14400 [Gemmataceae bacterium]|nr:hypothetical protein [Gemmataceae bacterium]
MNPSTSLKEPPIQLKWVGVGGGVGLIIVLVSLIIGLIVGDTNPESPETNLSGLRGLLTFIGLIMAGGAVTLRPTHPLGYALFAIAALLAMGVGNHSYWIGGFSNHWDSLQFLSRLFLIGAAFGFVWTGIPTLRAWLKEKPQDHRQAAASESQENGLMPAKVIAFVVLAWVFFHLTSIYGAMTSPEPSPWLTQQIYTRVMRPYHTTIYMSNAYQFYSPNPGDASQLWFCIEYGPLDPKDDLLIPKDEPKDVRWIHFPTRRRDYIDPLGLTYVRRLAYTEQAIQTHTGISYSESALRAVTERRDNASKQRGYTAEGSPIPMAQLANPQQQFLIPMDHVRWQLLPSYARFLANKYAVEGKRVKSVKIYRATHRILSMQEYHGYPKGMGVTAGRGGYVTSPTTDELVRTDPFDPTTFNVHFMGEFDSQGQQINLNDALLYWQIPILPKKNLVDYGKQVTAQNYDEFYEDYVNIHAGSHRLHGGKP